MVASRSASRAVAVDRATPDTTVRRLGFLERLGRRCARHGTFVVLAWLIVSVLLGGVVAAAEPELDARFRAPGIEADRARTWLARAMPAAEGDIATVVFHARAGRVTDPERASAIKVFLARASSHPTVTLVVDPVDAHRVSSDGRTSVAQVFLRHDARPKEAIARLHASAAPLARVGVEMVVGGEAATQAYEPEGGSAEGIGILAAIVVLVAAFGSVIAAGLPIGVALVGIAVGLCGLNLLGVVVRVPAVAPELALMLGLGVGIDYGLFVLTRHRQQLATGIDVATAAGRSVATAGRAVVFAGGTVVIAILGLALAGVPFVTWMGAGAALMVAVMVVGAVTLVPAVFGLAGERLRPRAGANTENEHADPWARTTAAATRCPWLALLVALAALLVLSAPILGLRLGVPDDGSQPAGTDRRRAHDFMTSAFGPGSTAELFVIARLPRDSKARALAPLEHAIAESVDVATVRSPVVLDGGRYGLLVLTPRASEQDVSTERLVHHLRDDVVPSSGLDAVVGGFTAFKIDISDHLARRLPLLVGAVVTFSFLLLVVLFRSIVVPLKAAVLNLLSIGAAYGVVVAVFQWGWGASFIGVHTLQPIVPFVPLLMFAILFGLSMDYEVFLLSRIREEWLAGADNTQSIIRGASATAKVITSAALIMICVFAGFVTNPDPSVKIVGFGLAVAVFVDATIVRLLLVPAAMQLMGRANWWLPRWLDRRLPTLTFDD